MEALAGAYLCLNKDQTRRFDTSKLVFMRDLGGSDDMNVQ